MDVIIGIYNLFKMGKDERRCKVEDIFVVKHANNTNDASWRYHPPPHLAFIGKDHRQKPPNIERDQCSEKRVEAILPIFRTGIEEINETFIQAKAKSRVAVDIHQGENNRGVDSASHTKEHAYPEAYLEYIVESDEIALALSAILRIRNRCQFLICVVNNSKSCGNYQCSYSPIRELDAKSIVSV